MIQQNYLEEKYNYYETSKQADKLVQYKNGTVN